MVLRDGVAHAVDSNEIAFRLAARGAFRQGKSYSSYCIYVKLYAMRFGRTLE